jgi:ubiquinone/menaquinone biosynthesis C-methylase UbiE
MPKVKIENGVVVGTAGGKYELKNPIARYLLAGFDRAFVQLVSKVLPGTILEVGCGEGHVTRILLEHTSASILATDLSPTVLEEARSNCPRTDRLRFGVADVEKLRPLTSLPDMVVCCEVLEHLKDPVGGLRELLNQRAQWYLLSVPREPLWRVMNMARGAYFKDFGNSPGHIQHWSKRTFLRFIIEEGLNPIAYKSPLPWTMVLCRRFQ